MISSVLGDLVIGVTGGHMPPINPFIVAVSLLVILLPTFLVTVGCIIYRQKAKNAAGVVLLVGNLLIVLWHIVYLCSHMFGRDISGKYSFGFLVSGLIFAIGFLLMAIAAPRKVIPPAVDVVKQSVPVGQNDRNDNDVQK